MASYYIAKSSAPGSWRVIEQVYRDGKRTQRTVKREEWPRIGFSTTMTKEEAEAHAKALNASGELKSDEHYSRLAAKERERVKSAHLPPIFVKGFYTQVLLRRLCDDDIEVLKSRGLDHVWITAQEIIRDLDLPYREWADEAPQFYHAFLKRAYSKSYVGKLIRILNMWGRYIAKKENRFFEEVPLPDKAFVKKINRTFMRIKGEGKKSRPLLPENLKAARNNFPEAEYNWLFISVWFGLRPHEIDQLTDKSTWRIYHDDEKKIDVFEVYMPKVQTDDPNDSWKEIPILFPEQLQALEYIRAGIFKRPLPKTIQRYLGERITNYGGRKAFEDLMDTKGQRFEAVSRWLGHLDTRTTAKYYRKKRKVAI